MYHYPPDARRAVGATDTLHISGESNPRFCGALELCAISPAGVFLFHRARRILFWQDKREWGVHSCGKLPHSPRPNGAPPKETLAISPRRVYNIFAKCAHFRAKSAFRRKYL